MEYDYASHEWKRVVLRHFDEFLENFVVKSTVRGKTSE
jgi:hypothetical protein